MHLLLVKSIVYLMDNGVQHIVSKNKAICSFNN